MCIMCFQLHVNIKPANESVRFWSQVGFKPTRLILCYKYIIHNDVPTVIMYVVYIPTSESMGVSSNMGDSRNNWGSWKTDWRRYVYIYQVLMHHAFFTFLTYLLHILYIQWENVEQEIHFRSLQVVFNNFPQTFVGRNLFIEHGPFFCY